MANENAVAGSPPGNVSVLANQGNGSFSAAGTLTVGHQPRAVVAGLFDTDADLDLAVANFADNTISVLTGGTGLTFAGLATFAAGNGPRALATGLFNAAGDPDLAVANENTDNVSILLGSTNATFTGQVTYAAGDGPSGVAVGDFDQDFDPDLAVANIGDDDVSILRGGTGGTFATQVDYPAGDGPRGVAVADFNGDGDLDLAIPTENNDSVAVLIGGAGATFSAPTAYPVGDAPRGIAVADFTRDGDVDLVTANDQSDGVTVIVGAAGAAFAPPVALPAGNNPFGVAAGDVNGEGEADVVVANTGSDNISVLLNRTPPDTSLASGPQGLTNATTAAFAFSADEPGATFECRMDGAGFAPCASPLTVGPLGDGAHSFEVRATDPAGNVDPSPATRAFTIDATAPETTIDSGPAGATVGLNPAFGFHVSEPGTFECRLDAAAFAACGSPFASPAIAPGPHSFEVRATDAAGNRDPTPARRAFTALVRIASGVDAAWNAGARFTRVRRLAATRVPAGAKVQVRCSGRGCPFARRTVRPDNRGRATATRLLRRARLRPGATVEVRVTAQPRSAGSCGSRSAAAGPRAARPGACSRAPPAPAAASARTGRRRREPPPWRMSGEMPTPDVIAFVRAALPPAPARVLEIGAGKGELAAELRDAGYDVTAIDPAADEDGPVQRASLLDVEAGTPFDAAVAVVSLHHVEPLEASCAHLATLVRPGGRLLVDEFDVARLDERAATWWLEQRRAAGTPDEHDAEGLIGFMRHHVHALEPMRAALEPHFALGEPMPCPYLHRWNLEIGLRDVEERLIARGRLPAVGARLIGVRRP